MVVTNLLKNQHLLWRAGFGPMAEEMHQLATVSQAAYVKTLFKSSERKPTYIDVADGALKGLVMGLNELGRQKRLNEEERRKIRQQSREELRSLNLAWLNEMVNSDAQL